MKTLFELKCPSCGAQLEYEEGMEYIFCKYCGTKILINDENIHTYKNIDYAEIEKAKNESKRISLQEDIIKKEYEKDEKETKRYNKNSLIFAGILIILVLILVTSFSNDSNSMTGMVILIVIGLFVNFLMDRSSNRKEMEKQRYKQRMRANGVNVIELSPEIYDYENKSCEIMRSQFEALDFKNIKTVPLGDLNIFTGFRSGIVDEIRINNEPMKDTVYYDDDPVVIKYHSK